MIISSALLRKKYTVRFFISCASGKQRLTIFDPRCRVHCLDGVAMLSHLWRIMEPCGLYGC